ncbi:hypothetical protein SOW72_23025 [Pseudomonas asiatica]|uniref:Disulfide bond formation protein B n=1 Tax=Pseudomonas asiatica TaxID=2219225 RepID=A0ABU5L4L9_9PSED|nr:hypothetical protein [Pseudomonas asiatica]MDZ5741111.1 hypothetical protein [Pseudomonas asiatica]MDZ5746159.1 hypothetical protein [Pseudomonas asiatica]
MAVMSWLWSNHLDKRGAGSFSEASGTGIAVSLQTCPFGDTAMLPEDLYFMFLFAIGVLALDVAAIMLYRSAKP